MTAIADDTGSNSGLNAPPPASAAGAPSAAWTDDRRFYIWVAVAALVHLLFVLGFIGAEPRRLGSPGGAENAIAVEFVTVPDANSTATVSDSAAAGRPPPSAAAPAPTAPPPARPTPTPRQPPEPPPEATAEPPAEAAPATNDAAKAAEPAVEPPALRPTLVTPEPVEDAPRQEPEPKKPPAKSEPDTQAKPAPPKPAPKTAEAKPTEAKPNEPKPRPASPQPPTRTAKLDLAVPSVPATTFSAAVGSGTGGLERPPGTTRSGLNDEFARGVIRALQRTMPQLSNTLGRVTVKITLDMNGNLVNTEVLRPSDVAGLDKSVVFATRQSSFPLPPGNAKPIDLIFFVTYIYR